MVTGSSSYPWLEAVREFLIPLEGTSQRPKTIRFYDVQLRQYWSEDNQVSPDAFGKRHFDRYLAERSKTVSPTTMRHDAVAAKDFFKWCAQFAALTISQRCSTMSSASISAVSALSVRPMPELTEAPRETTGIRPSSTRQRRWATNDSAQSWRSSPDSPWRRACVRPARSPARHSPSRKRPGGQELSKELATEPADGTVSGMRGAAGSGERLPESAIPVSAAGGSGCGWRRSASSPFSPSCSPSDAELGLCRD